MTTRPAPVLLVVAAAMALLAACRRGPAAAPSSAPPPPTTAPSGGWSSADEAAIRNYGYGPHPDPAITYQPDVVLLPDGPRAIRSVSANGLVVTVDGQARGVSDLAVGKIMFATARAVGRVADLRRVGGDVAVTVMPVALTDIVKDGVIRVDQEIDPQELGFQEVPGRNTQEPDTAPEASSLLRPAVWDPDARTAGGADRRWGLRFTGADLSTDDDMPSVTKSSIKVSLRNNFEAEPYVRREGTSTGVTTRIGVKVSRGMVPTVETTWHGADARAGLKVALDASLYARRFQLHVVLPIHSGRTGAVCGAIYGIDELDIDIAAGVVNGLRDNQKLRAEVPVDLTVPLPPVSGVPLTLQVKFKLFIETAFTAKNSTLTAHGRYLVKGPIGFEGGQVMLPKVELADSMMKSMDGVSVGVNGFVWAYEFRFLIGVGMADYMIGPYAKFVVSLGLWRGSDLGRILAVCKGATLKMDFGGGLAAVMSGPMTRLRAIFGDSFRYDAEVLEYMGNAWNITATIPDVPLCRGG